MKSNFYLKVYELCAKIPKGRVTTYKDIAQALGIKSYQAIGQVLKRNPYAPKVPCHRVVKADGSIGGFKGMIKGKEIDEKIAMLEKEGVKIINNKIDLEMFGFKF